jgi:crotonobetainyl-CoA:carnitine CoA-transferase CaiB-like acyl-CoA transferase
MGNRHPMIVPYETFDASDGAFVLAVGNDDLWRRFCRAIGLEELGTDTRFATNRDRVSSYDALRPLLTSRLKTRTRAEWLTIFESAGVPAGSVRNVEEVLGDEQVEARRMVERLVHPTVGDLRLLGVPVKLSDTPGSVRTPPPTLGQHTAAVLEHDLGLDAVAIEHLRQARAI